MLTAIPLLLAQTAFPAASLDVRTEDGALLPFAGAVLYNNAYGKGTIRGRNGFSRRCLSVIDQKRQHLRRSHPHVLVSGGAVGTWRAADLLVG